VTHLGAQAGSLGDPESLVEALLLEVVGGVLRLLAAREVRPDAGDPGPAGALVLGRTGDQAPPVVEVAGPIGDRPFAGRQMSFELSVRSPSGKAVDHVTVRLDGVFQQRVVYPSQANSSGRLRLDVSAPPRDTAVTFIAHAGGLRALRERARRDGGRRHDTWLIPETD
jgi:hypothetical protein